MWKMSAHVLVRRTRDGFFNLEDCDANRWNIGNVERVRQTNYCGGTCFPFFRRLVPSFIQPPSGLFRSPTLGTTFASSSASTSWSFSPSSIKRVHHLPSSCLWTLSSVPSIFTPSLLLLEASADRLLHPAFCHLSPSTNSSRQSAQDGRKETAQSLCQKSRFDAYGPRIPATRHRR